MANISTLTLPEAGKRVGVVCGPCEFPEDNAGMVLCHITDRWGSYALVLMNSGETKKCHSLTERGIGWHLL